MKTAVQQILTIYHGALMPYAERQQYAVNWGDAYLKERETTHHNHIADIKVDFSELTSEEAALLGFPLWDDSGLRLIPLWLFNHMAVGQSVTDINGESTFVHADHADKDGPNYMDNDHRMGATAWGFMPIDLRITQPLQGDAEQA